MEETSSEAKSRTITLTDGKQKKPLKIQINSCTIARLGTEGKNKFRKKFEFIVYRDQVVQTDEDLKRVLMSHEGPLTLLLTNTVSQGITFNDKPIAVTLGTRGLSYIVANEDSIESSAESQLKLAAELDGCIFAIGMPDLHPGKGIPIGAVVMTQDRIAYPQLVDNDIGCGMSFVQTTLAQHKLNNNKLQKLASSIQSIDCPFASNEELMQSCSAHLQWGSQTLEPLPELPERYHYDNLGTIGGGNHFAELQEFDEIYDAEAIVKYGIDTSKIHLLVHSGSRSLGSFYLSDFCDKAMKNHIGSKQPSGHYGVTTDSPLFEEYYANHEIALNYAARNRHLIARRLLDQIAPHATEPLKCKIDIFHNYMEKTQIISLDAMKRMASQGEFPKVVEPISAHDNVSGWIHRKGATPTSQSKILVIPGSRGTLSYLVEVNSSAAHGSGYSLAHGAGRCMNRSKALGKHKNQYPNARQLLHTKLGGIVVCDKKDLIYEEAPESYKDIDGVVKCLSEEVLDKDGNGIVKVLGTLRPLLTYKYKDPYKSV